MMTLQARKAHNWIAALLVALLIALCLLSMRSNSPTADEQNHISRGYHYLVTGNLDLNVAPPFVNALSAIPLLLQRGITIPSYDVTHAKTYINQFAEEFVWVYNDAESIINGGRLAIIALSAVLAYFVFRWASELWGTWGSLLALFLYVLDPNILAHSQLVTTDLGVACLFFISAYFLWRFLRNRKTIDLVVCGLTLGLAQATKFSALLLLPTVALALLIEAILMRNGSLPREWPLPARLAQTPRRRAAFFFAAALLIVGCCAFVAFWGSYRFETGSFSVPGVQHATIDKLIADPTLRQMAYRAVESVPVPFPTYFRGLGWLRRYAQRGAPAFLMGQQSDKGWWYYFLVAFAIKTPIPVLILLGMALLLTATSKRDTSRREYLLYLPVALFFLATFLSFLNIGYRHILPVLPFVFVGAGRVLAADTKRGLKVAVAVLCIWHAVSSLSIYPHYLAYFNEFVGGADSGYRYLVDSNLDWGQDLKNLKAYMDEHGLQEVHLAYFGSAHTDYYGIEALPLPIEKPADLNERPPAVYVISATYLQGGYLGDAAAFSWLRSYEPFAKIGYSIFLYRLP
jgi:hypothetical protein